MQVAKTMAPKGARPVAGLPQCGDTLDIYQWVLFISGFPEKTRI
jgi:hypothetical protein